MEYSFGIFHDTHNRASGLVLYRQDNPQPIAAFSFDEAASRLLGGDLPAYCNQPEASGEPEAKPTEDLFGVLE